MTIFLTELFTKSPCTTFFLFLDPFHFVQLDGKWHPVVFICQPNHKGKLIANQVSVSLMFMVKRAKFMLCI
jgi:hypothetical protein